ncbi:MAG: nucleotide exchange factor GrpE [Elusimicrobiota bacterium]
MYMYLMLVVLASELVLIGLYLSDQLNHLKNAVSLIPVGSQSPATTGQEAMLQNSEQLGLIKNLLAKSDEQNSLIKVIAEILQDAYKNEIVEGVSNKLIGHRESFVDRKILSNIIADLILLNDRLEASIKDANLLFSKATDTQDTNLEWLIFKIDSYSKEVQNILYQNDVEELTSESKYNPAIHKVIQVKNTIHINEEKEVVVVRKGYKMKEKLLRPAEVLVKKYVENGGQNNEK